jgi:hypothetical protein
MREARVIDKHFEIARTLTPLEADALARCCMRGSTRTNETGLVDSLLSGMCSNLAAGITNGWLVEWKQNAGYRSDGYINLYIPTALGLAVNSARAAQKEEGPA